MKIKKLDLLKQLSEGIEISELIDKDMTLIGNSDETISNTAVTANSTTDSFVDSTRQKGGINPFGGAYATSDLNYNGSLMEDEVNIVTIQSIKQNFPLVGRNLEVLIDSMKRGNTDSEMNSSIIQIISDALNQK